MTDLHRLLHRDDTTSTSEEPPATEEAEVDSRSVPMDDATAADPPAFTRTPTETDEDVDPDLVSAEQEHSPVTTPNRMEVPAPQLSSPSSDDAGEHDAWGADEPSAALPLSDHSATTTAADDDVASVDADAHTSRLDADELEADNLETDEAQGDAVHADDDPFAARRTDELTPSSAAAASEDEFYADPAPADEPIAAPTPDGIGHAASTPVVDTDDEPAEVTPAVADEPVAVAEPVPVAEPVAVADEPVAVAEPVAVEEPLAATAVDDSTSAEDTSGVTDEPLTGEAPDGAAFAADEPAADAAPESEPQPGDWRQVLLEFVDNPRGAVEKADRLVDDAVRSLTERINREHSGLRDAWHTHGEPSTEDLRNALRGYRDFFEKVLNSR